MSCISFMNGITKVNKEAHSWFVSLIPEHVESRYVTNIGMGLLIVHGGMVTSNNFRKLLAPQNAQLLNYFDQLFSVIEGRVFPGDHNAIVKNKKEE